MRPRMATTSTSCSDCRCWKCLNAQRTNGSKTWCAPRRVAYVLRWSAASRLPETAALFRRQSAIAHRLAVLELHTRLAVHLAQAQARLAAAARLHQRAEMCAGDLKDRWSSTASWLLATLMTPRASPAVVRTQ